MKKLLTLLFSLFLLGSSAFCAEQTQGQLEILCTTFPLYQFTRNIVDGIPGVTLKLMLPAAAGCPHDYTLTPQDLQKIARAEVLIINGLGMEEFLGAPITEANPDIHIINSSSGIDALLNYSEEEDADAEHHEDHDTHHDAEQHDEHDTHHDIDHEAEQHHTHHADEEQQHHHHAGVNPHLFVSPNLAARISVNIGNALAAIDPAHAEGILENTRNYTAALTALNQKFVQTGTQLVNKKIIEPHGVFDYLARDLGLKIVAVLQPHGQEPSAARLHHIIKIIQNEKPGAIFTEPQFPDKAAKTLARETGIAVIEIDPVASGPETTPRDYYQKIMEQNLKLIRQTLGTK